MASAAPCSNVPVSGVFPLIKLSQPLQRHTFSFLDFYEAMELGKLCKSLHASVFFDTFIRDLFLRTLSGKRLDLVKPEMDRLGGCQYYQKFLQNLASGQCKRTDIPRGGASRHLGLECASNCYMVATNPWKIWEIYNSDGMKLIALDIKDIQDKLALSNCFQLTSLNTTNDEIVLTWRNDFESAFAAIYNRHNGAYVRDFALPKTISIENMSLEMCCERTKTLVVSENTYSRGKKPVKITTIDFNGNVLFEKIFPRDVYVHVSRATRSILFQEGNRIYELDLLGNLKRLLELPPWNYDPLNRGNLHTVQIIANEHLIVAHSNHGEIHVFDYKSGEGHRFNVRGYNRFANEEAIASLYLVRDKICVHFAYSYFVSYPLTEKEPTIVIYNKVGDRVHFATIFCGNEVVGVLGNKFLTHFDEDRVVLSSNLKNRSPFKAESRGLVFFIDRPFSITKVEMERLIVWDFLPQVDDKPNASAAAAASLD